MNTDEAGDYRCPHDTRFGTKAVVCCKCYEADRALIADLVTALTHAKQAAITICREMWPFIDHAATCMYERTGTPDGDFCNCYVKDHMKEIVTIKDESVAEANAALLAAKEHSNG